MMGASWAAGDGDNDLATGASTLKSLDVKIVPELFVKFCELATKDFCHAGFPPRSPTTWKTGAARTPRSSSSDDVSGVGGRLGRRPQGGQRPDRPPLLDMREGLKRIENDGNAAAQARKPVDAEIISILGNHAKGEVLDGRLVEAKTT